MCFQGKLPSLSRLKKPFAHKYGHFTEVLGAEAECATRHMSGRRLRSPGRLVLSGRVTLPSGGVGHRIQTLLMVTRE